MSEAPDADTTPRDVEEGEAQRYLEHEDPEAERDRAGLGEGESGTREPLPDQRRDGA